MALILTTATVAGCASGTTSDVEQSFPAAKRAVLYAALAKTVCGLQNAGRGHRHLDSLRRNLRSYSGGIPRSLSGPDYDLRNRRPLRSIRPVAWRLSVLLSPPPSHRGRAPSGNPYAGAGLTQAEVAAIEESPQRPSGILSGVKGCGNQWEIIVDFLYRDSLDMMVGLISARHYPDAASGGTIPGRDVPLASSINRDQNRKLHRGAGGERARADKAQAVMTECFRRRRFREPRLRFSPVQPCTLPRRVWGLRMFEAKNFQKAELLPATGGSDQRGKGRAG